MHGSLLPERCAHKVAASQSLPISNWSGNSSSSWSLGWAMEETGKEGSNINRYNWWDRLIRWKMQGPEMEVNLSHYLNYSSLKYVQCFCTFLEPSRIAHGGIEVLAGFEDFSAFWSTLNIQSHHGLCFCVLTKRWTITVLSDFPVVPKPTSDATTPKVLSRPMSQLSSGPAWALKTPCPVILYFSY